MIEVIAKEVSWSCCRYRYVLQWFPVVEHLVGFRVYRVLEIDFSYVTPCAGCLPDMFNVSSYF